MGRMAALIRCCAPPSPRVAGRRPSSPRPYNPPRMPRSFEGDLNAEGLPCAVVASRFNDEIVSGLLAGAVDCLRRHGAHDDDVELYRVPGAFEIPAAVNLAQASAVIAL